VIVLVAGSLLGIVLGYHATQPAYFMKLTANDDGIQLEYGLFTKYVFLPWMDIENISIQKYQLIILGKRGERYASPVVYRGEQSRLLQSVTQAVPSSNH
jgi:hypothetical protein